ncbi:MAG: hypothetical protein NT166_11995 [Candidatus Aminicenantes bacterium]|nr:hypothetical protein [Candidatus Aminicenantes bacterium]
MWPRTSKKFADDSGPVFDKSGKYLYFLAATDAGSARDWFTMSRADMWVSQSVYLAVLSAATPSPLAKESDEEKGKSSAKIPGDGGDKDISVKPVVIDFEGLSNRVLALPGK